MRRRTFISLLCGAAAASPRAVCAQQAQSPPLIGYLDGGGVPRWFEAFRRGLRDLGYVENRSVVIERRSLSAPADNLSDLAAELVRLKPQVIVASGSRPALALKNATATIPIVVAFATDPVAMGLVETLARPGGNVTGLSNMGAGLLSKRLELLAEITPGASRFGVIWTPSFLAHRIDYRELQSAARTQRVTLDSIEVSRPQEFDAAFKEASVRALSVAVLSGPMAFANRDLIVAAAARHKVRAIYYDAEYAESGGLMSYGPNLRQLHGRAAVFVDKILKGAKPADLPVEQPTRFDLVISLKAAKALGLEIPEALLARADEVIE